MHKPTISIIRTQRRHRTVSFSTAAAYVLELFLQAAEVGTVTITLPSQVKVTHIGKRQGPDAILHLRRWRGLVRLVLGGSIGLARAYIDHDCTSPDIRALVEFGARNERFLAGRLRVSPYLRLANRFRHWRRTNTCKGSRRNIAAHYDLGNAFYAFWLDRGMNYSSALFSHQAETLEEAQAAKLRRIVDLLELQPGRRILEIGCGWGALVERLLVNDNSHVTGITLSVEQLEYARSRLGEAISSHRCDLHLQDYRDVQEKYHRVVSIEMIEAVGERYWPLYFKRLRECLMNDGVAVIQAITIAEQRFAGYRRRPDFIQQYIFPGGMLPTKSVIRGEAERAGFCVVAHETFGESYALTVAAWRERFLRAWPQIAALGFDDRFKRMWEFYLAYCEVGFCVGTVDVTLWKLVPRSSKEPAKLQDRSVSHTR
jgi:cyclopropane-fatty-acyl-phospholipid synthase